MDKEIYLVISEILIKQDEIIVENKATNEILKEFMNVSSKQWEAQQQFNERFFDSLQKIEKTIVNIEKKVDNFQLVEEKIKHFENLEERIVKIERLLKVS